MAVDPGERMIEVTYGDGECFQFWGDDENQYTSMDADDDDERPWDGPTAEAARAFGNALVGRLLGRPSPLGH